MKVPLKAAAWLMPSAKPRFRREGIGQDGRGVRHQQRRAHSLEDPHHDEPDAAGVPVSQVTLNSSEKKVNTAKPRL